VKQVLITALKAYRVLVSPRYGQTCRYYPTCSAYALHAIETHGATKGSWLAMRRLGRCHPWTPGGVDLVPPRGSYRWWGVAEGSDGATADIPPSNAVETPVRQGA
jgi:putative membrane protein insertion efficiency factor